VLLRNADGQLEKLKVYECKAYLRMHKLRLSGKKEELLNRIREHIEYELHPLCYLLTLSLLIFHKIVSYYLFFPMHIDILALSCDSQTFRVENLGEIKYPMSSFVLNCKGEKAISYLAQNMAHS
jgi:hypothetical protein